MSNEQIDQLDEIRDVIAKHLPAQVGDVLRQRLEQAQRDAADVVTYKQLAEDRSKEITRLKALVDVEENLDRREKELDERERAVEHKEIRQELNEYKVHAAELRVQDAKQIVGMVFANNRFKYRETESVPVERQTGGGYSQVEYHSKSKETEGEN